MAVMTYQAAWEAAKAKLQDKVIELEQLHDIVIGRKLKMMQLEKQNEVLNNSFKPSSRNDPERGPAPPTRSAAFSRRSCLALLAVLSDLGTAGSAQ